METKAFDIGDIVKGTFNTVGGNKITLAKVTDVMESNEGQMVSVSGEGVFPQWVSADECTLLRGVPLEGSLNPNEAAIVKRLLVMQEEDERITAIINIAYAHERQGILERADRKVLTKVLEQYKDEQRDRYIKLSKRLIEINRGD